MTSSNQYFLIFSTFLLFLIAPSFAQQSFRPKALVVPVSKDAATLQYVTRINQRTPLVPLSLVLDLGGQFLWVDCEQNYVSSTYRPARCNSAQCSLARAGGCGDCFSAPRPGCNNNTCGVTPDNSVTHTATGGEVAEDVVSIQSTGGSNPGRAVTVSRFLFSCAPTFLLEGLAGGFQVWLDSAGLELHFLRNLLLPLASTGNLQFAYPLQPPQTVSYFSGILLTFYFLMLTSLSPSPTPRCLSTL